MVLIKAEKKFVKMASVNRLLLIHLRNWLKFVLRRSEQFRFDPMKANSRFEISEAALILSRRMQKLKILFLNR